MTKAKIKAILRSKHGTSVYVSFNSLKDNEALKQDLLLKIDSLKKAHPEVTDELTEDETAFHFRDQIFFKEKRVPGIKKLSAFATFYELDSLRCDYDDITSFDETSFSTIHGTTVTL